MTSQTSLYKTDAEGNVIQSGYPHIVFKNTGAPMIEGTRIKVQVIAIDNQAWHLPPEGIKHEYPSLTLGEIHSALAYYWDHKDEIDQQIEDDASVRGRDASAERTLSARTDAEDRGAG